MIDLKENPPAALRDWTREEKERLLSALASDVLAGKTEAFPVMGDADRPIAFLLPAHDPSKEFGGGYSIEYFLELQRRVSTPEDSMPWSEFRSLLASDLGLESPKS